MRRYGELSATAKSTSTCSVGQCSDSVVRPASTNVIDFKTDLAGDVPLSRCNGVVYISSDMVSRRYWRHNDRAPYLSSLSQYHYGLQWKDSDESVSS